jgi:hypothetical protein
MSATTTTSALLFNWEAPRRRNLAITGFLTASFAAHVACFYFFQVVYPPIVSLTPAPHRVSFISARSEEGATLLRWVDAEDPALASTTRRAPGAKRYLFGKIQHIPSYSENEPALKEAPPLTVDLRVPSAQPPGPVSFMPASRPTAIGPLPTKVTFSSELERIGEPKFVPTSFKASTLEPPQNAQFRIAVDQPGAVVYCFALTSSGDPALDEQARQQLVLCRFPARPVLSRAEGSTSRVDSLVWGIATIEWGNDVATVNPKASPSAP